MSEEKYIPDDYNYKTSTDYEHLFELLKDGYKVVCFVTYDLTHGEEELCIVTDVCTAEYDDKLTPYERIIVASRGENLFSARQSLTKGIKEYFIHMCERKKLTYIEPTKLN